MAQYVRHHKSNRIFLCVFFSIMTYATLKSLGYNFHMATHRILTTNQTTNQPLSRHVTSNPAWNPVPPTPTPLLYYRSRRLQGAEPDADGPPVRLKLLHLGQLHDRAPDVPQPLGRQVRAGDVLDEGPEVDARVLLSVAVRRCA